LLTSTLPPGITFDALGIVSGTPRAAGIYDLNLQVSDGVDTVFRTVQLRVYDVEITTSGALPNAVQNVPYSASLSAAGGAGGYSFKADNMPPGLELHPDGTIEGTPTVATHWWFNVTATDANNVASTKTFSLAIASAPASLPIIGIAGQFFDDCSVGSPCALQATVTGGARGPFVWEASGLPPGMAARSGSGNTTSWIAPHNLELWGVPTAARAFHIQLTVTDGDGQTATNTFDLRVSRLHLLNYLVGGTINAAYSHRFIVIGGRAPYSVALVGGRLPVGLTLDPAEMTVAGTPVEIGNFRAVLEVRDADGETQRTTSYLFIGHDGSTPRAVNDHFEMASGTTLTVPAPGLLANDLIPMGVAPSVEFVTLPPGGLTNLGGTGGFSYTPSPGFTGTVTFDYVVHTNVGDSNVATVSVLVRPGNNPPVATNGALTTTEDVAANSVLTATDGDGPAPLTFSIVTNGTRGTATITNPATGAFTYTPNPNEHGTDTVTFKASDGAADSNIATIAVTIDQVGDANAQTTFHSIGDLPGGPTISVVRDATRFEGVIYAVGASAANNQIPCLSPDNPAGCVTELNPDTAVLWTRSGTTATLTALPDLVSPNTPPVNARVASAITRDAAFIASQARSNAVDAGQAQAVRVARSDLSNVNLGASPFPAVTPPADALAISEDGSILYGVAGNPTRALRFDVNTSIGR
jgi:hypothetical protein